MVSRRIASLVSAILLAIHLSGFAQPQAAPREGFEFFEKHIRPVLVDKCYKCHSTHSEKLKGALHLDSKAGMLKGGNVGPAVVPFKPDDSVLMTAIRYKNEDMQMPPKQKLSDYEIKNFEIWIKMGAPDPRKESADEKTYANWNIEDSKHEFWSFKPVASPAPPKVKNNKWPRTPIDRFILSKLEQSGLTPVADADKKTLLRRATYDLIGLPPTTEEINAFLHDKSSNAFEKVIDRLLASPAYGEQWGRHWLDIVRYADTSGCNSDFPIPVAYKYRNYVIDAFNGDKPYDRFLREQIAGDLLPFDSEQQKSENIVATGYLAISRRFGSRNNEFHLTIEDTINNLGHGLLAMSIGCSRCHDHKFDPIPQKDYYALYGILSSTKYAFPGTEVYRHPKDFVPIGTGTNLQALVEYQTELAKLDDEQEQFKETKRELEARLEENEAEFTKAATEEEKNKLSAQKKEFEVKLNEAKAALEDIRSRQRTLEARPPLVEKAYAVSEGKPAAAKVQKKGSPFNLGEEVPRGFLQVLGGQVVKDTMHSGRLELAQWLTDPTNPLTARVMVNRIWQWHFGKGIVQTPNDFGIRGEAPTHPELLDYLAGQFIQSGWSVKRIHRAIMLSRAYRLSTDNNTQNAAVDAENDLLWRFDRRRLSAEEIRDSMLAISGTLDRAMPGSHTFPPENEWKFSQHRPFYAVYETKSRSVYLMQQRIKKHPFLAIWDGSDPNAATGVRPITATPIQALALMNSPFIDESADQFAVRIGLAHTDSAKRIDYAFQLIYGRAATRDEISSSLSYLKDCRKELKKSDIPPDQNSRAALTSLARVLFSSNEFLFVD